MQRVFVLIVVLTTFLISCNETKDSPPPADLIPQEKMISILSDISLTEARYQRRIGNSHLDNQELVWQNYNNVFERHQVDLNNFKSSYDYYLTDPNIMQAMYDSVIVRLTKEQTLLKNNQEQPK